MPYDQGYKEGAKQEGEHLTHNHEEFGVEIQSDMWLYERKEARGKQWNHEITEHEIGHIATERASKLLHYDCWSRCRGAYKA